MPRLCFAEMNINTIMDLLFGHNLIADPENRRYLQRSGGKEWHPSDCLWSPETSTRKPDLNQSSFLNNFFFLTYTMSCQMYDLIIFLHLHWAVTVTDVNWMLMGSSKDSLLCRSISSLWCRLSPACITSSAWSIPGCLLSVIITIRKSGNLADPR